MGFIDDHGLFSTLELPPGFTLRGSSDAGDLVASSGTSAFLISNGQFTPIQFPGASYTIVSGINNAGEIVGWYADYGQSVYEHGFVATPTALPEPSPLALVGFALVAGCGPFLRPRAAQ